MPISPPLTPHEQYDSTEITLVGYLRSLNVGNSDTLSSPVSQGTIDTAFEGMMFYHRFRHRLLTHLQS